MITYFFRALLSRTHVVSKCKMMKTIKRLGYCMLIAVGAISIFACSERSRSDVVSVRLDERVLDGAVPLEMHEMWYPADSIYSYQFYVYADTVLLVENRKEAGNFLDVYNIPHCSRIARLLPYGEGPEELLFVKMNYEGAVMRVTDYINRKLYLVDVDKVLIDSAYTPQAVPFSKSMIVTSAPVLFGDSVVCVNPFHYVNRSEGIDQRPPRLVPVTKECPEPSVPMDFDYMTMNVGQGLLGANIRLRRLFFALFHVSSIEFYDSNLNLVKEVLGPVTLPEEKLSIGMDGNGNRDVCYKGTDQPMSYTGFTTFSDKLYFVYTGKKGLIDRVGNYHSYILCFDWDGNFVKSYSAPEHIYALSVSASHPDTFFASIRDEAGNPKLVKLVSAGG